MTHHASEPAQDEHAAVHLPDPSIWPLVAGFGALFLGIALVWWSDKGSGGFTGPFLGVAVAVTLLAGFGWAYQDGVMKRKAEAGSHAGERHARFTQVVTFALAEAQFAMAQAEGGILHAISASDNALHDLAGFQDLRIIASSAATGSSQVLVETTWSDREGLATYEETRRTILDLVNVHAGAVVPGSVQVFDMEVVRDTKDVSVRFGMGAAVALLGSLIVGGFMVGAGLNLFKGESTGAEAVAPGGDAGLPANPGLIGATDNKFSKSTLEAPPSVQVSFTFVNGGRTKHNLHFLDKANGKTLAEGAEGKFIDGGQTDKVSFKSPAAGTYFFLCDLHPDQMSGTFVVKDGAPVPGAGGPSAAPAGGTGATADPGAARATDSKFDKPTLEAPPNTQVTFTFTNAGKIKHNLHFLDKANGKTLVDGAEGKFIDGGQSEKLSFKTPAAGTYYFQCDLHPDQMTGTFVVKDGAAIPGAGAQAAASPAAGAK